MASLKKGKKAEFDKEIDGTPYKNGDETRHRLNREERARKYCVELREGVNVYTGEKLTERQMAYRAGYMKKSNEDTAIYNWKKEKGLTASEVNKFNKQRNAEKELKKKNANQIF